MAEEISGEYELVFHGPIDYSEEAIAHLKKVMSESFGLSPYAVDLFFEKAPFPIKKAKTPEELQDFMTSLQEAGGDVSIRHPEDEPITHVHIVDPRKRKGARSQSEGSEGSDESGDGVMTFDFEELVEGEFSEYMAEATEAVESISDTKDPADSKKAKKSKAKASNEKSEAEDASNSGVEAQAEAPKEESKPKAVTPAATVPSFELEDTGPELYGKKDITPKSAVVLEAKNKLTKSADPLSLEIEESAPSKPDNSKIELIAKLRNKSDTGTFSRSELEGKSPAKPELSTASYSGLSMEDGKGGEEAYTPPTPPKIEAPTSPPSNLSFGFNLGDDLEPPSAEQAAAPDAPKADAPADAPKPAASNLGLSLDPLDPKEVAAASEQSSAALEAIAAAKPTVDSTNLDLNLKEIADKAAPAPEAVAVPELKNDTFDLNITALNKEIAAEQGDAPQDETAPSEESEESEGSTDDNAEESGAPEEARLADAAKLGAAMGLNVAPEEVPTLEGVRSSRKSLLKQYAAPMGLFAGLILLLGGMNWFYFSAKTERELSTLAAHLFNSPIFVAFQETALELVVAKRSMKPPQIRYWKGELQSPQISGDMTFSTADEKVSSAELSLQAEEPPPLTPEQIVREEKGIPWMRRITASAFQWEFQDDGGFKATAPARLSIEWGHKMHRAIADVELHGKVDLNNMLIATDITVRANIEDPTGLPLVFIEPITPTNSDDEGRFRIYVSTQIEAKFLNALDLEAMTKAREEKEKESANLKKDSAPKSKKKKEEDSED